MATDTGAFRFVLRGLRTVHGLSVEDLAKRSGLCVAAIRHLEAGTRNPTWQTACQLADALGIGLDGFREGPNQRPVETGALRDARLAALQRWHREDSATRRRRDELLDNLHPATRAPIARGAAALEPPPPPPPPVDLGGPEWIDRMLDQVEEQAVAGADALESAPEPVVERNTAAELDQVEARKRELGELGPKDRKAFHQARRRAERAGKDWIEARLAGYRAVAKHREIEAGA